MQPSRRTVHGGHERDRADGCDRTRSGGGCVRGNAPAAERVLIDERRGRLVAARLKLRYTGILGILVEAKSQGLIPTVKPLLDALINRAGFWIADPLYNSVLRLVEEE